MLCPSCGIHSRGGAHYCTRCKRRLDALPDAFADKTDPELSRRAYTSIRLLHVCAGVAVGGGIGAGFVLLPATAFVLLPLLFFRLTLGYLLGGRGVPRAMAHASQTLLARQRSLQAPLLAAAIAALACTLALPRLHPSVAPLQQGAEQARQGALRAEPLAFSRRIPSLRLTLEAVERALRAGKVGDADKGLRDVGSALQPILRSDDAHCADVQAIVAWSKELSKRLEERRQVLARGEAGRSARALTLRLDGIDTLIDRRQMMAAGHAWVLAQRDLQRLPAAAAALLDIDAMRQRLGAQRERIRVGPASPRPPQTFSSFR